MAFRLLRLRADGTTHNGQTAGGAVYSAKVTQTQNFAKDKFSEIQEGRSIVGIAVLLGCWLSAGLCCCAAPYQRDAGLVR